MPPTKPSPFVGAGILYAEYRAQQIVLQNIHVQTRQFVIGGQTLPGFGVN